MRVDRGIVTAYDATNHKADVLLVGSLSRVALGVPVSYQVAPEQMAVNKACGVLFFGEGDAGVVVCTMADAAVAPLGLGGFGPVMDSYDVLRGWKDDFVGKTIHQHYMTEVNGAGSSVALCQTEGGILAMIAGPANGRWARIWLGDNADNYPVLKAQRGWRQIARMQISHTTNIQATLEAVQIAPTRQIVCGIRTDAVASNWLIRTWDAAGTTNTDTGVAADTAWHWHQVDVYPSNSGHRVDYFLDGTLIGYSALNIPTEVLTPNVIVVNRGVAASRSVSVDFWAVIPRWLG
jgi:hypothetical protein